MKIYVRRTSLISNINAPWRLPPIKAFTVLALGLFGFFFAGSAPSPAFVVLQNTWHFSSSLLTVAFGVYAIALLVALLLAGSLSDYIGRRPVIFVALLFETLAMIMFSMVQSIEGLITARVVQGLATGVASGALAAAILEAAPEDKKQLGALVCSISPLAGLAAGAFLSGVALELTPYPILLVFGILIILFSTIAVLVIFIPETAVPKKGMIASIVPHFSIPQTAKIAFIRGLPILFTTWAIGGLYLALAPSIIVTIFNFNNGILNGLAIAILSGVGAVAPMVLNRLVLPKAAMMGMLSIIIGASLMLISLNTHSLILFFIATSISGIGFGGAFSATMQTLAPLALNQERAELFTVIYIVCYLALSIPVILAGLVVASLGLLLTIKIYILLLFLTAIAGLLLQWSSFKELTYD
jgi:MFS family permease